MLGIFRKKSQTPAGGEAFELNFDLPAYRQQESRLPDPAQLWLQLDSVAAHPVHLLVELNHFLHELNRTYLPSARRYSTTLRCVERASGAMRQIYFEHQKGKALPENPSKREALTVAVKCAKELAGSFKRIIKSEYKSEANRIRTPTRRVRQCMIAVLELIHAEQRLKALRYQKLSERTWRECNNVFFILQHTGEARKTFRPMGLSVGRAAPNDSMAKAIKTNAQEIYSLIQLLGLIDANTLSMQQCVIAESYLKQYLPQLLFSEFKLARAPLNAIMTSRGHDGPPGLWVSGEDATDFSLVMNIKPLLEGLNQDYQRLSQLSGPEERSGTIKPEEAVVGARMNNPEDLERLLALSAILAKFREAERFDTRKYNNEVREVYVYNGFTAGFRMLNANNSKDMPQLRNQLSISLAQHSAPLAESSGGENFTRWEIVNESAGGVLLRTQESRYIKNLFIGQLIVFARSKSELPRPTCAYVVRICRDYNDSLEVSLKILASHIESVVVQTEFLKKNAMGMPGIMIFDAGEDLQLLMHQSHRLSPGSTISIQRSGDPYTGAVGGLQLLQREFLVYSLGTRV